MMYNKLSTNYFIPKSASRLTAEDLTASAAVYDGMICTRACRVSRLMFVVTTLVATDTIKAAVEFNRRPTIASSAAEVLMGTLTIPDTSAVGTVVYKDIDPVEFAPGEELSFEHSVAGTDGSSAAGAGFYSFEIEDSPEEPLNQTNMVASA